MAYNILAQNYIARFDGNLKKYHLFRLFHTTSELLDFAKNKPANWMTSTGLCVDANGAEDGRGVNMMHYSEDDCFELCEKKS